MTPDELEQLLDYTQVVPIPRAEGEDRTLLYGWSKSGQSRPTVMHHVYLKDGEINLLRFTPGGPGPHSIEVIRHAVGDEIRLPELVPNKRLFAEACDFEYCKAVAGFQLPMIFSTRRLPALEEGQTFYGPVVESAPAPTP